MRKTKRLQSAQALALAAVCAAQVAAPGLTGLAHAQTPPVSPTPVPPPTAAPAAPPSVAGQAAPPPAAPVPAAPAPAAPAMPPTAPVTAEPGVPPAGAPGTEPVVPAAAEPTAPPAAIEPMNAQPEPPPPAPPVIEAAPLIDEQLATEPKSKVPSYVMWAVGGASLVTGAVLGVTALTAKSDFDDNPSYSTADKVEGRAVAADIAFGLGAVLLVTGTVFYFMPDSQESRPTASNPKRPTARVQVAPMFGRTNGGAVSIQF